jgi:hypothetical protein
VEQPRQWTGGLHGCVTRNDGRFSCGDERLNRLHEAVVWSLRGNICDIPTDCPQRERAGWTGDWQLFVPTAAFLYDVAGFSVNWRPGGGLSWAEAAHESPYGRIEAAWRLDGGRLHLRLAVPPGTEAAVVLPSGRRMTAGPGTHVYVD